MEEEMEGLEEVEVTGMFYFGFGMGKELLAAQLTEKVLKRIENHWNCSGLKSCQQCVAYGHVVDLIKETVNPEEI